MKTAAGTDQLTSGLSNQIWVFQTFFLFPWMKNKKRIWVWTALVSRKVSLSVASIAFGRDVSRLIASFLSFWFLWDSFLEGYGMIFRHDSKAVFVFYCFEHCLVILWWRQIRCVRQIRQHSHTKNKSVLEACREWMFSFSISSYPSIFLSSPGQFDSNFVYTIFYLFSKAIKNANLIS